MYGENTKTIAIPIYRVLPYPVIVVYETSGQFVTSFGRCGHEEGEFCYPYCITSCADGFIHVCDFWNNRVQIF